MQLHLKKNIYTIEIIQSNVFTVLQQLHLKIFEDCNFPMEVPTLNRNVTLLKFPHSNQKRGKMELANRFYDVLCQIRFHDQFHTNY